MKTKQQSTTWYVGSTGNHQGLVIDENTGANIAVCYDKAHAPLIAAAPELLAAARMAFYCVSFQNVEIVTDEDRRRAQDALREAIEKATQ